MNGVQAKNNRYKNGEYNKHYADRYEMSQSRKEPTMSQNENPDTWRKHYKSYPMKSRTMPQFSLIGEYNRYYG